MGISYTLLPKSQLHSSVHCLRSVFFPSGHCPITPGAQPHMAPEPVPMTQPNRFMLYSVLLS